MIVIMVEILSRAFTSLKQWLNLDEALPRRKRILDDNDNLGHSKRFKRSTHQPSNEMEPSENVPSDINPFSSRGHMLLNLAKKKDNKVAELKPAQWKSTFKENCLEISSDEDDDVIIVSEKRNRPPLMPSTQYGESSQLQNRTEDARIVQNSISTRPISNLPLHCSTPASTSSKAAMSRFCPPTGRRALSSNTSSTMSKMRHSSASRIGRTSSASLNLISKTRTISAEENMVDRFKYKALLESYIKTHTMPRFPKPFLNFQEVEKTLVPSSRASCSRATSKPKVEILDLTKPEKQRRPVRLDVKSLHSKDSDDGSDVEIVSVTPVSKSTVPKVNSFENRIKDSKYLGPEWLENLCQNYQKILKDTNQESQNQQIKKDIYAKQNEKALAPIEERIKRHMVITETIILDEPVEEEPKLPELTPNMLKQIQAALVPRPPSAVVAEGFGLRITRNDMHTLANVNWLNDEVINFYMNLLIERSKKEGLPKVYAFNTFFYPKLIESGHASLRRWTRKVDIFAQDLIIVPVHLGVHWCMAIIDLRNKVVEYYDSMGSDNNKCLKALLKYLEDESNDKKKTPYDTSDWKAVNMKDIPQQMNGSDCGMFACTFAEYKCRNAKITFSQKEMPYFRKKMVYEILTGKLMM